MHALSRRFSKCPAGLVRQYGVDVGFHKQGGEVMGLDMVEEIEKPLIDKTDPIAVQGRTNTIGYNRASAAVKK